MQVAIPLKPLQDIKKSSEASDFNLYLGQNGAPIIVTQPGDGVLFSRQDGNLIQIPAINNTVSFLQGLSFSVTLIALDPSNSVSPLDTSRLTFEWRKNGSPLYKLNNLNDGKGTNTLTIEAAERNPDVTGEYIVSVSNEVGVTTSTPLIINVYDRLNVPKLYKNLISNGNAELGLSNWDTTGPITVFEYDAGLETTNNFSSILASPRASLKGDAWTTPIEEPYFRFSKSSNWVSFNHFWRMWKLGQLDQEVKDSWLNWYYVNKKPNITANEYPEDPFANFYPAKRYVDEYNENYTKFGLLQENQTSNAYFSREPIKYNDTTTTALTQTIELDGLEDFIDGRVTGTSNTIGHFFAYAGVGISSYTYKLTFDPVYKIGPLDDQLYTTVVSQLQIIKNNANQIRSYSQDYPTTEIGIQQKAQLSEFIAYRLGRFNTNSYAQLTTLRAVGDLQAMPVDAWTSTLQKELYLNSGPFRELFHTIFLSDDLLGPISPRIGYFTNTINTEEELQQTIATLKTTVSKRLADTEKAINDLIIEPATDVIQAKLAKNGESNDVLLSYVVRASIATETSFSNAFPAYKNVSISPNNNYNLTGVSFSDLTGSLSPLPNQTLIEYNSSDVPITRTEKKYIENKQSTDLEIKRGYELAQQYDAPTESNFYTNYNLTIAGLQFYLYENTYGGVVGRVGISSPPPPDLYLDTLIVDGNVTTDFRDLSSGKPIAKRDIRTVGKIELIPRCSDLVDFSFRFIGQFGDVLATDTLNGPTVDDLMAVKERMFYSTAIAAWFDKTTDYEGTILNKFDTEQTLVVPIMYGSQQIGYLDKKKQQKPADQVWLEQNYPIEYLTKLKNLELFPDAGAAAFFAVQKKLRIPLGTRSIEVKINMTHSSRAYDQNLVTAGEDSYQLEEIPVNHLTGLPKFYRSGNPRVGVANVKLCLYDGEYKRSSNYPTYFIPPYNVWSERLKLLRAGANVANFEYVDVTKQYLNTVRNNEESRNRQNAVNRTR